MVDFDEFVGLLHKDKENMKKDISEGFEEGEAIYYPIEQIQLKQHNLIIQQRTTSGDHLWGLAVWGTGLWDAGFANNPTVTHQRYWTWNNGTDFKRGTMSDDLDIQYGDLR